MFSDRWRKTKIVLIILALLGFGVYADFQKGEPLLERYLDRPSDFIGDQIPIHQEPTVLSIGSGRIRLRQLNREAEVFIPEGFEGVIPAYLNVDDIRPGQYVEAITRVDRDGGLRLETIRIAYLRRLKIAVSIIPAVLVTIILLISCRCEKGRVVIKNNNRSNGVME